MKHRLAFLFFFLTLTAYSQLNVSVIPADTTVCFRDSVAFTSIVTASGGGTVSYRWQKNFIDITGATDSIYAIPVVTETSPGIYRVIISVPGVGADTSNDVFLRMHPRMYIDTLYRYNPLGCYKECKGQFKVLVSGGTPYSGDYPYIYEWNGGHSQDTIVFGLCPGRYKLTVTDSMNCHLDTSYFVDYLKSPKVTLAVKPDTVIYKTNPTIEVSFPDSMAKYLTNWTWDFSDSIKYQGGNPVSHTYSDTIKPGQITVRLTFTDQNGCDTTVTTTFMLKVAKLTIPNLFTPNDDNVNDKFEILLEDDKERDFREAYLSNELYVYDRWGRKVFNAVNYKSEDWTGERQSDGTYFYILKLTGQYGDEVLKGSVTILR